MNFEVQWQGVLEASTPKGAAEEALRLIRMSSFDATNFMVQLEADETADMVAVSLGTRPDISPDLDVVIEWVGHQYLLQSGRAEAMAYASMLSYLEDMSEPLPTT